MKKIFDIYALIVLYNKKIENSSSYKCIENNKNIKIIICDNSNEEFDNKEFIEKNGHAYLNMGGNKGLSKAYNRAIDHIKLKQGILCLFDDDTEIPDDYFTVLKKKIKEEKSDIYLPIVYDKLGIISPCLISDGVRVNVIKSIEEVNDKNVTGINSGMAIDLSVFENYRYDESYFLDYVDHKFLKDMKKLRRKISIFNVALNQQFSANENKNVDNSIQRYKIFKKDFRRFCNGNFRNKLYCEYFVLRTRFVKMIKLKSLKILFK